MTEPELRTWFLARCLDCRFDLPFPDEHDRDQWADGHRTGGHVVRSITERRWRDPTVPPVAQRIGQLGPNETVAGSNPAGGTLNVSHWMREIASLTPHIDAAKVGTTHEGHDGWGMRHDRPGETMCSCGEPITELLRGRPAPAACGWQVAYRGPCQTAVDTPGGRCPRHPHRPCEGCGHPAVGECTFEGQFVCGAPLCDRCWHYPSGSGHGIREPAA